MRLLRGKWMGITGALGVLLALQWLVSGAAQTGGGAGVAMEPGAAGLQIEMAGAPEWTGEISVSTGRLLRLDGWSAAARVETDGGNFTVRPAGERRETTGAVTLFATLAAPDDAKVRLRTNQGEAEFALSDARAGEPLRLLEGQVEVRRTPPAFRLTESLQDEDFPAAAAAPDGTVWAVYVAYQSGPPLDMDAVAARRFDSLVPRNNGDRIYLVHYDGRQWSAPREVTEGLSDVWRPSVAVDGKGVVWVAWSEQREGNWDVYRRRFDPKKESFTPIERVTKDPGADINAVLAADSKGGVWQAWQAWRGDNFDILLLGPEGGEPQRVSGSAANEWNPAIAADGRGNVYVAWDGYAGGSYDVYLRRFGASPGETVVVAGTPWFEARPAIACDAGGRVWIAYVEDNANWGKDYATRDPNRPVPNLAAPLYMDGRIRVKVLAGGRILVPGDRLERVYGGLVDRPKSCPRLVIDGTGNVWLFFRHHAAASRAGMYWTSSVVRFDGRRWSPPQSAPDSDYIIDNRAALAASKQGVVAVYASDARLRERLNINRGEGQTDLYATLLSAPPAAAPQLAADSTLPPAARAVHPRENEDIARMRAYRIEAGGKTYRLLRGEFHRHTEFTSHRDQDGPFENMWRYALDAASMDWIGNGDHDNGYGREYVWWLVQKTTDVFNNPPHFIAPFTYERSVRYPNGHRNVMFVRRGIRPLPRWTLPGTPEEGTPDTKLLYAYLRHFGGICAVHTSGTRMGTDWRDNDPEVEPVVEIYQGHRHNYEAYGAPRSPNENQQIGGYQPAGFVWNAWARGYRLGVQSSSDHVSTHMSYAVALAEDATREALVDAFRKRHTYAATDNIVLDVRAGDHIMGDEFTAKRTVTLKVRAIGTDRIERVVVIKNNGHVYQTGPTGRQVREVEFTWRDTNQPSGTLAYYYVRVEQADGQLAWSSPIWVRYE